jgi:hypothetical protein
LVWQVMTREPYASARRVFWIVDNGSAQRGQRSIDRLEGLAEPRPRPPAHPRELVTRPDFTEFMDSRAPQESGLRLAA